MAAKRKKTVAKKPKKSVAGQTGPAWMRRALNHPELHTKNNESVKTASVAFNGKEILFPTIRARGPGLEKLPVKQAFQEAVRRKDFLTFDTPAQATAWSKAFSNELGRRGRVSRKQKPRKR